MLGGNSGYSVGDLIKGVIRFAQTSEGCVIDGTVDGLTPGEHGIHIHECGDISKGCDRWVKSKSRMFRLIFWINCTFIVV